MALSTKERKYLETLFKKYENGQTNAAQTQLIESYLQYLDAINQQKDPFSEQTAEQVQFLQQEIKDKLIQSIRATAASEIKKESKQTFDHSIETEKRSDQGIISNSSEVKNPKKFYLQKWTSWSAAAILLIAIGIGTYLFLINKQSSNQQDAITKNDVAPGQYGAVLHLSDGKTVLLDKDQKGTIAIQNGIKVVNENGQLKYIGQTNGTVYNDITTGKARQWKMVLPDGTKVWLNAESSIHYPLTFNGKERLVEITGEVYFEVVHNAAQPFRVKAGNQLIEDIGTAFDVNAYPDETTLKTTLVKGAVKIAGTTLSPGQQATINKSTGKLHIEEVDPSDIIAWVNGQLSMENIGVPELMKQLSRWYDVEVVYEGDIPDRRFGGILERSVYLSNVINVLVANGIHARLEGKKIIVSAK